MISKGDFLVIKDLYAKGKSIRQIAKLLKIDRKTVAKKLQEPAHQEIVPRTISKLSILEPYKKYIREFIGKSSHRIPYSAILDDIKDLGYLGSRSILQDFLAQEYRKLVVVGDAVVRFETQPGEQLQVDWTTIRWGKNPIYGFVATMGHSRQTFVYFTDNMEAKTLVMCHELAFLFFGGVPKNILFDNMKTVVEKRNAYGAGKHKFHPEMYDLAKRLGFKIKLCKPYRPQTKGKVERFNSYLKGNFYRPLVIKLKDANLEVTPQTLNQHINPWLTRANNRIHATTKQKPSVLFAEEQKYLLPYLALISVKSVNYKKALPQVIVQKPILTEYDQLVRVGGVA
jgi:transposase